MELPKTYDASTTESGIYQKWLDSGYFNPDNLPGERKEPFTIIMPPPNVTGTLHIGHALFATIQDILTRYQRMNGKRALWLPGTDHAAIATQSKVEAELYKKEKKTRFDFSREDFLKLVEDYAQTSHDTIITQLKRLGASADWSREAYTLDAPRTKAVRTAFKTMYEDGIIYRGARIINWDPKLKTTVSDEEIEWKEEASSFYYLKYGPFTIGTSRPETKFGDKYVVMHPDDERYAQYKHGDKLEVEWINGPITATVIKDEAVDKEFGTGVMTITPWHDAVDFEIAQRHGLDKEQVIDERGVLLAIAGEFAGQHIKKARAAIVEKLQGKGLVEKIDDKYLHRLATNSRGGGTIEPQIKEQWFIDVNKKFKIQSSKLKNIKTGQEVSLKELIKTVVESGEIKIIPEHFEKTYFHWIDNLRDWCISRQIWYGHQIPVWYSADGKTHLPKKINISFVRHCESKGNAKKIYEGWMDSSLSETGKRQAEQLAENIRKNSFDHILSSDLKRSKETAEAISEKLGIPITALPELREVNGGHIEGETYNDSGPGHTPLLIKATEGNTGETLSDLEHRAQKALSLISELPDNSRILLIGHNSFLAILAAVMEGKKSEDFIEYRKQWHLDNGQMSNKIFMANPSPELTQDTDTLDTWFSSGLWTFSTLGWPDKTKDLELFHPSDVMETGYDILFFWVARMVLMSTYHLGQIPFKTVYLHGLVRDKDRQKMSKSKGNVIDPLGVIDAYGTDALRFALIFSTSAGNDIPLAEDKIKGMKHFANKLWNIARFVITNIENQELGIRNYEWESKTNADKEIISKLDQTVKTSTEHLEAFRIHEAAQEIYQFTWYELADIYLEASKGQLSNPETADDTKKILLHNLITTLKLLHPFMPFVTEHIWGLLDERKLLSKGGLLMVAEWPKGKATSPPAT